MSKGTIIVTGGSRGIGAATSLLAAERGYAVCINYTSNSERAEQVVASIRSKGGKASAVQADVSDEAAVQSLFETAERELGPLTALVNNAGTTGKIGRLLDLDTKILRSVLDVNILGTILCARQAVRRMSTARGGQGGAIVNVSSRAAQLGSPNEYVHYAASKAAVETFTIGMAKEVATEGIRINCVSPGLVETEIHAAGGDAGRVQRIAGNVPLQRGGQPEEIAKAILWLLSDEASYCVGSILVVSGGR
ncbi:SDR family oxidoreductase [Ktedonosporobacter rubrisoli]|uniref:SDR family oxidoreductase n=1 Tax=Ktedonosporobacter rubrisoli TaxID=2509675 RepID=A0A4P6JXU9_KTERU|nr:SDR family oxidoreductase [Ktedonosporobacter rubrisoli]QBD79846.1 SDR family oxidoreductase [Ktedonosporobacter rubrisoli]